MRVSKNIDEKTIAKRMLLNALKIEESLAELLRTEAKILRKQADGEYSYEEIRKINKINKYILFSLTMIDDRIQVALEIYNINSTNSNDKI